MFNHDRKNAKKTRARSRKAGSPNQRTRPRGPILRFSPPAWAKLLFFRDRADVEVGGFGITPADDLLYIEQFATVRQEVTGASVCFDDRAVADFFDAQVDAGRRPQQFARLWLHSHPGESAQPSGTDEQTFARVFGRCDWAVMFILAGSGKTFARLRFNVGPGGQAEIPVEVDFNRPFGPSDAAAWEAEYQANIKQVSWQDMDVDPSMQAMPNDWLEELEAMPPAERAFVLDE